MAEPTYDELKTLLIVRFPELALPFEEVAAWHPAPGTHLIFAEVFWRRLAALLESGASRSRVEAMLAFVEELSTNPRGNIKELVTLSVIEPLVENSELLRAAWPFMGPNTFRLVRAVAQSSGNTRNLPDVAS